MMANETEKSLALASSTMAKTFMDAETLVSHQPVTRATTIGHKPTALNDPQNIRCCVPLPACPSGNSPSSGLPSQPH